MDWLTDKTRELVKSIVAELPNEAFFWPPMEEVNTGLKEYPKASAYFAGIDWGRSGKSHCCLLYHEPMITGDTFVKIVPWPEKNILDRCWDWFRRLFNKKRRKDGKRMYNLFFC